MGKLTIAVMFSNICTYNDVLPQGSPCSPKLANLVTWKLDVRIQGFVGKRGITYTRYADDLSFSGLHPLKVVQIIPMIKKIIEDEKFKINLSKTRIAGSARAKIVTGLVLSNDTIGIGTRKYKNVRSKIYHLVLPSEQSNTKLLEENLHGGVGLVHITKGNLERIKIPLPPFSIQQQIVTRIEQEQQLINANKQLIQIFEQKIKDEINKLWQSDTKEYAIQDAPLSLVAEG